MLRKIYLSTSLVFVLALFAFGQNDSIFFYEPFDGAIPSTWTTVEVSGDETPSANWFWTNEGPGGPFATDPLESPSMANGWVIFDSDLNCREDAQDAWLISPTIDASQEDEVWLVFQTYYRTFNDRPQLRIGSDLNDLSSWETIEIFPGVVANDFGGIIEENEGLNPQAIILDLTEYLAGENGQRIAFQFLSDATTNNNGNGPPGCAYSWQLDDVQLIDRAPLPAFDLRVNPFFAVAPNAITPTSQVEPIYFLADFQNVGLEDQTDATLYVTVTDGEDQVVFIDSIEVESILADSLAENQQFPNAFDVPATPDFYTITYSISSDVTDEVPINNLRTSTFGVIDTLFAKEIGATRSVAPADDNVYSYGNVFWVPNGEGIFARYISFGVANADELVDRSVTTLLYEWQGEFNTDGEIGDEEYTLVGFNTYNFDGTEEDDLISVPVSFDEDIELKDSTYYLAVIQYAPTDDRDMFLLASEDYDYTANLLLYGDSLQRPQYGAVLDVSNTGSYSIVGFGLDIVPVVRLSIGDPILTSSREPELPRGSVSVFPNPAKDQANLRFNLETTTSAQIELYNQQGQRVRSQFVGQVKNNTLPLPVEGLASGNYLVRVQTPEGVRTLKLVLQR